ncbi:MAG: type II toxin-antitoxin system VapC family toxin [Oscillatoriaceae cyanobacterium]|uniref:PIN domain-containing protein n=1 Tax=[Phormidium] sp. ETS-05 TaxID=222819 RepID=UPI0018EEF38D|nr:PIN domain-containing protein [[Phormidium] sp. ETS-05]
MSYLLDTNIVSALVKNNRIISSKLHEVEVIGLKVFISGITYYEVKRGLIATNATRQLSDFTKLQARFSILLLDNLDILEEAAKIHADLKRRGTPIGDADILIAATAIHRNLTLVSHDADMLRVPGLVLEDWLAMPE